MTKNDILYCDRCKKEIIPDTAYILVSGSIVMFDNNVKPQIFTCIEQAYNYAQKIVIHPQCWIDTLSDHGIELYDMQEVAKGYKEKRKRQGKMPVNNLLTQWKKIFMGKQDKNVL